MVLWEQECELSLQFHRGFFFFFFLHDKSHGKEVKNGNNASIFLEPTDSDIQQTEFNVYFCVSTINIFPDQFLS